MQVKSVVINSYIL